MCSRLIFGIENPRTSDRIHFVGGIRGTAELERLGGQRRIRLRVFHVSDGHG